jgi:anaphase-promoting complex subunit 4
MEKSKPPTLLLQAEKVLPQPAHPHLIACCPTMDLVAVVNQDEQLNVYRFGGQRALGLQRRSPTSTVVSLCWKFNGKFDVCVKRTLNTSGANSAQANTLQ